MKTLLDLQRCKQNNEKITVLTAYDASFARLLSQQGIDVLMVGDSLGNVIQGRNNTIPVTIENMVYHTECVARGNQSSFIIADLPFMTYATVEQTLINATRLMQAGAAMVKLEGSAWLAETISHLSERGIPVCAHLGLTPQSVHALGGHRVQGREEAKAQQILQAAQQLEQAGAAVLVLECIPAHLAKQITESVSIPVIGIGAGADCDGQVLVTYDMLGISPGAKFKFVKNFMAAANADIARAIDLYIEEVKAQTFPSDEHCFQ